MWPLQIAREQSAIIQISELRPREPRWLISRAACQGVRLVPETSETRGASDQVTGEVVGSRKEFSRHQPRRHCLLVGSESTPRTGPRGPNQLPSASTTWRLFSKTSPRARGSGPLVVRATQGPHPERNHPNAPEEREQALYQSHHQPRASTPTHTEQEMEQHSW